jgi:NTP pyrophosphatase (non-canonical NTP hydrolase)
MEQNNQYPKLTLPQVAPSFNNLTPVETECLAILAEEAGELCSASAKVLRHGKNATCDGIDYDNLKKVAEEFADVLAAMSVCMYNGVLSQTAVDVHDLQHAKIKKLKGYVHHAKLPPIGM